MAAAVSQLRIGAVVEQYAGGGKAAMVAGQHQQAVAGMIAQVRRHALAEQVTEPDAVADACGMKHMLGERQRGVIQFCGSCLRLHRIPPGKIGGRRVGSHCLHAVQGAPGKPFYASDRDA